MMTRLILIGGFILVGMTSFGQQQTFLQNQERARAEEFRTGVKSHRFVSQLKEGTVSTDLFTSIAQAMETKEGYVSVELADGKITVIAANFITLQDVEGVLNQFGETFIVDKPLEQSLMKR
ncbi:MAG: hypothetical protein QE487_10165 [Fluviicola sp.]|nr:hypothetical protein [Fluviicola sp.]